MRSRVVAACAAGLLLGGAVGVPVAHAAFGQAATATASFSAAALSPPTGLTAVKRCTLGALGVVLTAQLDLAWTPSATAWAGGQRVVVTSGTGLVVASQDLAPGAASTSVALPLLAGGAYTATVTARYAGWSSSPASAGSTGC